MLGRLSLVRGTSRDTVHATTVCQALLRRGIGVGIHYPIALPNLQAYSHLSEAERACPRGDGGFTGDPVAAALS